MVKTGLPKDRFHAVAALTGALMRDDRAVAIFMTSFAVLKVLFDFKGGDIFVAVGTLFPQVKAH